MFAVSTSTCVAAAHPRINDERLVDLSYPVEWMAATTPSASTPTFDLWFYTVAAGWPIPSIVVYWHTSPETNMPPPRADAADNGKR